MANIPDQILERIEERILRAAERGRSAGYFGKDQRGLTKILGGNPSGGFGAKIAETLGGYAGKIQQFNQSAIGGGGLQNVAKGVSVGVGAVGAAAMANPYVAAAFAVGDLIGKMKDFGDTLHDRNRDFAEFSASMATVMAQSDVRNIMLKREQGERRAESAQELAEARDRMNRGWSALNDRAANRLNTAWARLMDMWGGVGEQIAAKTGIAEQEDEEAIRKKMMAQGHMWLYDLTYEEDEIKKRRAKRLQ